jgi:NAD(P)-dependent dehydrogenase (short-subunit alcohol dehydrogenase family)
LTSIDGHTTLITGASRGLGLLLAREFAREGCRIAICSRDGDRLRRAQDYLRREGVRDADILTRPCDVADRNQVAQFVAETTQHFGQIDILVNNAGEYHIGPVASLTVEDYQLSLDVMYWGMVYATLAVLPQMRARRSGRIVNITSMGGFVSVPCMVAYNGAKFAATGFSQGLRAELARDGIQVTTVAPGFIRTGSQVNVYFRGPKETLFMLASLALSLPFISTDADRAARRIVRATKRGDGLHMQTIPAHVLTRFNGLFPGTTANLNRAAARRVVHNGKGHDREATRGLRLQERQDSALLRFLTTWGRRAAQRFNQYGSADQSAGNERLTAPEAMP